ncbi:hypothetical protein HAX54_005871 [Datura stramonium]|uniref:Uncharacterized protein n=1 Tax=Datura stramonium TaxID=4076 RepID=A0ABS8WWC1_DATST|nr:hypothetical protein [Datura stramonium]
MLGLITFAFVILTCFCWKCSGETIDGGDDPEFSIGKKFGGWIFKEKIVVIMAGDLNPTFLAVETSLEILASPLANKLRFEDLLRALVELIAKGKHGTIYKINVDVETIVNVS